MNTYYSDPLFEMALAKVPSHIRNEVSYSFAIADRLQAIMDSRGLKQTDLARMTGKKKPEISKWLSGTQNFTLRTISLIEEALDCKLINVPKFRIGQDAYYNEILKRYYDHDSKEG